MPFVVFAVGGYLLLLAAVMWTGRRKANPTRVEPRPVVWITPEIDEGIAKLEEFANGAGR